MFCMYTRVLIKRRPFSFQLFFLHLANITKKLCEIYKKLKKNSKVEFFWVPLHRDGFLNTKWCLRKSFFKSSKVFTECFLLFANKKKRISWKLKGRRFSSTLVYILNFHTCRDVTCRTRSFLLFVRQRS